MLEDSFPLGSGAGLCLHVHQHVEVAVWSFTDGCGDGWPQLQIGVSLTHVVLFDAAQKKNKQPKENLPGQVFEEAGDAGKRPWALKFERGFGLNPSSITY